MSRFGYLNCRELIILGGSVFLSICPVVGTLAQDAKEIQVSPSENDRAAAAQAKNLSRHARPARTERGQTARRSELSTHSASRVARGENSSDKDLLVRYPADVVYNGGPVVETAESHPIYLQPKGKCPIAECWGNPEGFLRDLARSEFVHVLDQYTGQHANDRYTVGSHAKISYVPPATPLTDADMIAVVHAVVSVTGENGYGHIYHIFLPPGQDECFDSTFKQCYSPDNSQSFAFCAYHGSADTDAGHVVYTVEPYQDVPGCQDAPGTPNGQLEDSTNDTLSHELFETISDPDLNAWWNSTPAITGLFAEEIGDECVFIVVPAPKVAYGDPSVFRIGRKIYAVQLEYSNAAHGCTNEP